MAIAEVPAEARAAVRARRRKEIDELDYRRELRRLDEHGFTQREISRWLGIAQPSVTSAMRTAAKVSMPLKGFSGRRLLRFASVTPPASSIRTSSSTSW